jgi:hypothetical protein
MNFTHLLALLVTFVAADRVSVCRFQLLSQVTQTDLLYANHRFFDHT